MDRVREWDGMKYKERKRREECLLISGATSYRYFSFQSLNMFKTKGNLSKTKIRVSRQGTET